MPYWNFKDVKDGLEFEPKYKRIIMKITFATGNPHKLQEIKEIAGDTKFEFVLPPEGFDPIENGTTFEENSLIKAREAARLSGMISLADDSGLCVEALNGEPGIHSARYAETPQKRIDKLLDELKHLEKQSNSVIARTSETRTSQSHNNDFNVNRKAKFVCAMTLVSPSGEILFQTRGECNGEIARKQFGTNGFGYDPVFIVEDTNKTMAEMSENDKNLISHRGKALRKVLNYLNNL